MRALADAGRLRRLLRELGREAREDTAIYLTGGATAVLFGWRDTTIDADILIVPERDSLYRALPRLKEELQEGPRPLDTWDPAVVSSRLLVMMSLVSLRFAAHPNVAVRLLLPLSIRQLGVR